MTPLRKRMLDYMTLKGYSERTKQSYVSKVRDFALHYNACPSKLEESQIISYLTYLREDRGLSKSSINAAYSGLKILYVNVLDRSWNTLHLPRIKKDRHLPIVFTVAAIQKLLASTENIKHRTLLMLVYSAGLRKAELQNIRVSDLQVCRKLVFIRKGKGGKHCIIPCGGLSEDQRKWISTKKNNFLAPNKKVIAPIFKGIFMSKLLKAFEAGALAFYGQSKVYEDRGELTKLFRKLYQKNWNVYAKKPFGGPVQILNYLSRYTHRVAISNHRIVSVKGSKITFSVKNYKQKDEKGLPLVTTLTLEVLEFIRRFLLHVLPKGFQRIRYYGILSTRNRGTKLKAAQEVLQYTPPPHNALTFKERLKELTGLDPDACPFCKQKTLRLLGHVVQQFLPIGRAPPVGIVIVTPEGEYIPLAV